MIKIKFSKRFDRSFSKMPIIVQKKALEKIKLFHLNYLHPSLKLHKLKGKLKDFYSFSIDYNFRIILKIKDSEAKFYDIGDHSIYR